jgi:hypothetical protein
MSSKINLWYAGQYLASGSSGKGVELVGQPLNNSFVSGSRSWWISHMVREPLTQKSCQVFVSITYLSSSGVPCQGVMSPVDPRLTWTD